MKARMYITVWAIAIATSACYTTGKFARLVEDDIYYVPGERSLYVEELEQQTGQVIDQNSLQQDRYTPVYNREKENTRDVNANAYAIGMARYATRQEVERAEALAPGSVEIIPVPEDDGYWIGGFHGSEYDLQECTRIMNRYPEGFALFGNGYEIALNLSFSSDWNVYTLGNRYWWFPSPSNIELYSKFLFGTYPTIAMTITWNDPRFDYYAFDRSYSFRFGFGGTRWGAGWYWGYYDPWYYSSWYHDPFWHRPYYYHRDRYYGHHHDYYPAGERSNYVSRYVHTGRRDAPYYNNRTNYPGNRYATTGSAANRQNTNARTTYTRGTNAVNRTSNTRTGAATSTYTRNANVNQKSTGTSTTTNSTTRANYTRSSATPTTSNSATSTGNNNTYRQSNSSSSSSNSSATSTRQNSSSSSNSSSYSRSGSSSSSSGSSSSSSSSSRSSGSSGSSSSRSGRR